MRQAAGKALLVALALIISLMVAEVLVRVTGLAPELLRIRLGDVNSAFKSSDNPILGYELRENAVYSDQPHSENSRTNSHGQWDVERTYAKPLGRKRILVLGDSVVLGGDVFDLQNTMTGQLERMLADRDMEVLNFGVTGYSTRAEVELLKVKGLRYAPDLVILVFLWNDYDYLDDLDRTKETAQPAFARLLFASSAVFRMASLRLNLFGFRDHLNRRQEQKRLTGEDRVVAGLRMLKELSKEYGFATFVAVWPYFGRQGIVDLETRNLRLKDYFEVQPEEPLAIEGLVRAAGLPVFRLSSVMRKLATVDAESSADVYTVDGSHATEEGCHLAARTIKSILEAHPEFLDSENRSLNSQAQSNAIPSY